MEAGKERDRTDDKGKREGHRQTEPSRDRSITEVEVQQEPLSLRETETLMEPVVQQERLGRGGGVSEPASFL